MRLSVLRQAALSCCRGNDDGGGLAGIVIRKRSGEVDDLVGLLLTS